MSERWLAYYNAAKARRRTPGRMDRTRYAYRRWHSQQRRWLAPALLSLGILLGLALAVLQR
jgi:hypothetical protein